jgi:glycosyltransferase involved in cell wall biosynthesis
MEESMKSDKKNISKDSFVVIYLGRRGGGAKFTHELCRVMLSELNPADVSVIVSSQNELISHFHSLPLKVIEIDVSTFSKKIKFILDTKLRPKTVVRIFGIKSNTNSIFAMLSPMDVFISKKIHKYSESTFRVIHDANRHPGEIWPGKLTTRFALHYSDTLVALSHTVEAKLKLMSNKKVVKISHPVFEFERGEADAKPSDSKKYALFIGRVRKYKGVKQLVDAWGSIGDEIGLTLTVAGEGRLPKTNGHNLLIINRWLSEIEIQSLVKHAAFLIFPYQEASQSGWIPYAISMNKKIVITPVGGLIEQVGKYSNAIICEDISPHGIKLGILKIVDQNAKACDFPNPYGREWAQNLIKLLKEKPRPI